MRTSHFAFHQEGNVVSSFTETMPVLTMPEVDIALELRFGEPPMPEYELAEDEADGEAEEKTTKPEL